MNREFKLAIILLTLGLILDPLTVWAGVHIDSNFMHGEHNYLLANMYNKYGDIGILYTELMNIYAYIVIVVLGIFSVILFKDVFKDTGRGIIFTIGYLGVVKLVAACINLTSTILHIGRVYVGF